MVAENFDSTGSDLWYENIRRAAEEEHLSATEKKNRVDAIPGISSLDRNIMTLRKEGKRYKQIAQVLSGGRAKVSLTEKGLKEEINTLTWEESAKYLETARARFPRHYSMCLTLLRMSDFTILDTPMLP
jgi:hypothetical protein